MSLLSSSLTHLKRHWVQYGALGVTGMMEYKSRLADRERPGPAALKTLGTQALWFLFPAPMFAMQAAPLLSAAGAYVEGRRQELARPMMFGGQTFGPRDVLDSAHLATNRSRALAAINQSKLNARNIIGQEAALMSARYSGAGSIGGAGYNSFYRASY